MMSSAARCKRVRQRRAEGKIVLQLELDEVMLSELLVAAGLLAPATDYDRNTLKHATEQLLVLLAAETGLQTNSI